MPILKLSNVSKSFRDKSAERSKLEKYNPVSRIFKRLTQEKEFTNALKAVSFEVKEGEIFGLLGPNGAGKTTLIKILTGLMEADSGKIELLGKDVERIQEIRDEFNVVFARGSMFRHLSGKDNLNLYSDIYRVEEKNEKIKKFLDFFELEDKKNRYVDRWSTGEHMRLKLAKSLLNDPRLLFLDEPSIGLDHKIALKVRDFLKKLNREEGVTILLTTHYMEEADYLCDRIAIIDKGRIVEVDKPRNLKKILKKASVLEFRVENFKNELLTEIKDLEWVEDARLIEGEGKVRVILKDLHYSDRLIKFVKANYRILELNSDEPTLGDVFIHLTGRKLEEEE